MYIRTTCIHSSDFISFSPSLVVEVNFKELNYSVNESAGEVNISLRITGQFFIPLHAVIEVSDGTATGEP